jgi:hypothetical protein
MLAQRYSGVTKAYLGRWSCKKKVFAKGLTLVKSVKQNY